MRIPAMEALFPAPWTAAARRMLPSPSPQLTATAMWGPVLGWCALELLAESIDAENPERVALDLFDRLRLREPFAQAFAALGFEGEEGWRVAARIKVVLLTGAGVGKTHESSAEAEAAVKNPEMSQENKPTESTGKLKTVENRNQCCTVSGHDFSRAAMPQDKGAGLALRLLAQLVARPDVRWLTGVHEAEGHDYLVRERYEELLWWLLMPSLLRLAGEAAPSRAAVAGDEQDRRRGAGDCRGRRLSRRSAAGSGCR